MIAKASFFLLSLFAVILGQAGFSEWGKLKINLIVPIFVLPALIGKKLPEKIGLVLAAIFAALLALPWRKEIIILGCLGLASIVFAKILPVRLYIKASILAVSNSLLFYFILNPSYPTGYPLIFAGETLAALAAYLVMLKIYLILFAGNEKTGNPL